MSDKQYQQVKLAIKSQHDQSVIDAYMAEGLKLPNIARRGDTREQIMAVVNSMSPKDEAERMLLIQMTLTHRHIMEYMRHETSAFWSEPGPDIHAKLIRAEKLMKLYTNQLQTLQKYRNKGAQHIVIERLESEQTVLATQAAVNQAR